MRDHQLQNQVSHALEQIRSALLKDQREGVANVKRIFSTIKRSHLVLGLSRQDWNLAIETLVRVACCDQRLYLKNSKKPAVVTRLSATGAALREVVEAGVEHFDWKCVKILTDNLINILGSRGQERFEPHYLDYWKCLKITWTHLPHVEHLRARWSVMVDFYLDSCRRLGILPAPSSCEENQLASGDLDASAVGRQGSRDGLEFRLANNHKHLEHCQGVAQIFQSIRQLCTATNAPVLERAPQLLFTLITVSESLKPSQVDILVSINLILMRTSTNKVDLTKDFLVRILPILRTTWPSRDTLVKEQILVTLVTCRSYLVQIVREHPEHRTIIEGLRAALISDYSKRAERDQLKLEHLEMHRVGSSSKTPNYFSTASFSLRNPSSPSRTATWALPSLIAWISLILDENPSYSGDSSSRMPKRLRKSSVLTEILNQASHGASNEATISGLQILCFYLHNSQMRSDQVHEIIMFLIPRLSDQNSTVCSWAYLALCSCCLQPCNHDAIKSQWVKVWLFACGALPTLSSRCSSHLMSTMLSRNIISFFQVTPAIESLFSSIDLAGPAHISDAALAMWEIILDLRILNCPNTYETTAEKILYWLFGKWGAKFTEAKANNAAHSITFTAHDVANLLLACIKRPGLETGRAPLLVPIDVSQAWILSKCQAELVSYQLLLSSDQLSCPNNSSKLLNIRRTHFSSASSVTLFAKIMEFHISETRKIRELFEDPESTHIARAALMRLAVIFCICSMSIVTDIPCEFDTDIKILKDEIHALSQKITGTLILQDCEPEISEAAIETIVECLPDIEKITNLNSTEFEKLGLFPLLLHMTKAFDQGSLAFTKDSNSSIRDESSFGFDSDFDSHSGGSEQKKVPRSSIRSHENFTNTKIYVACFSYLIWTSFEAMVLGRPQIAVPSIFFRYLVNLLAPHFYAGHLFLISLIKSPLHVDSDDIVVLFEHMGKEFLQAYEWERSEVVLRFLVEGLTDLTSIWLSDKSSTLFEVAHDLYSWLITQALKPGVFSTSVLVQIVALVHKILSSHHEAIIACLDPCPSVDILIAMLKNCEMPVKFAISKVIPDLLSTTSSAHHPQVLSEIEVALSDELEEKEMNVLKFLLFTRIGTISTNLLSRCIFHILKTVRQGNNLVAHAQRCIHDTAISLKHSNSKELFKMFSSDILFHWVLSANKFEDISFAALGYRDSKDFCLDNEEEATSLAILMQDDNLLDYVSRMLLVPVPELVERNFAKASAYSVMRKTFLNSPGPDDTPCFFIQNKIGSARFQAAFDREFARVLGFLILCVRNTGEYDDMIMATDTHPEVRQALKSMKTNSHSEVDMAVSLMPHYPGEFLPSHLNTCSRLAGRTLDMRRTNLFVYASRMILDSIHQTYPSLYACCSIRKLRILISLTGDAILEDYALERTLSSIQQFLSHPQCACDIFGIFMYLLEKCRDRLALCPKNLASLSIGYMMTTHRFLLGSNDVMTDQVEAEQIVCKFNDFQAWIFHLWSGLRPAESNKDLESFLGLIEAVHRLDGNPVAAKDNPKGKLLMMLLQDERGSNGLLNKRTRDFALKVLTERFDYPALISQDVFGSDEHASGYVGLIWNHCRGIQGPEEYLCWTARTLGQAFFFDSEGLREVSKSNPDFQAGHLSPEKMILNSLTLLVLAENRTIASYAESCLRTVLKKLSSPKSSGEDLTRLDIPVSMVRSLVFDVPMIQRSGTLSSKNHVDYYDYIPGVDSPLPGVPGWARRLCLSMCARAKSHPFLVDLMSILENVESLGLGLLNPILHIVLQDEIGSGGGIKKALSETCNHFFDSEDPEAVPICRTLTGTVLYLRGQPYPDEKTYLDRLSWIDLDPDKLAAAAHRCGYHTTALMFLEQRDQQDQGSGFKKESGVEPPSPELLLKIFKYIDEPDSFYGVDRGTGFGAVIERLDYERDGSKSLMFRSANMDSEMRFHHRLPDKKSEGVIRSFQELGQHSIALLLPRTLDWQIGDRSESFQHVLESARQLSQWDIPVPESSPATTSGILFQTFQSLSRASVEQALQPIVRLGMLNTIRLMQSDVAEDRPNQLLSAHLTLAILSQLEDVLSVGSPEELGVVWNKMVAKLGRLDDSREIHHILLSSSSFFSILAERSGRDRQVMKISPECWKMSEVRTCFELARSAIQHGNIQNSLATVSYLDLVASSSCPKLRPMIKDAVEFEMSSVLWSQNERETSIQILQKLKDMELVQDSPLSLSRPKILATLAHRVEDARTEKPEDVMMSYLRPAIEELKEHDKGIEAGRVFNQFASFCDRQLQNGDLLDQMARLRSVIERRKSGISSCLNLMKTTSDKALRKQLMSSKNVAEKWVEIEVRELERLSESWNGFLSGCLENYLRSLQACDHFDKGVLKFFSLWLEYFDLDLTSSSVAKHLGKVPTRKFAPLINQLSSRLSAERSKSQHLFAKLVFRFCQSHPFHGMYQIYGAMQASDIKDQKTKSRVTEAEKISAWLKSDKVTSDIWTRISLCSSAYHQTAEVIYDSHGEPFRGGRDVKMDSLTETKLLSRLIPKCKIPPPSVEVEIRANKDYSNLPYVTSFEPRMRIASGLSAPKILVCRGSDGREYKQLVKGGSDDLRQDAIMEQIFSHVSLLLLANIETRRRRLKVRTYKVLPLSPSTGVIEFVSNTISLNDYLVPAHAKYYPQDLKTTECRKRIQGVTTSDSKTRVRVFQQILTQYHPVLRHFFFERFLSPDDWYARRLAYTRTSAAISILGYILGLGDRHCQNILMDQISGEVVHIDFGVAFEAGRVLPIPELVPFRLTRDIVDAMGCTKTEGVFRRCCQYTLQALQNEGEDIMTLLNVLRYDPLYTWTLTTVRAKRLQKEQQNQPQQSTTNHSQELMLTPHLPANPSRSGYPEGCSNKSCDVDESAEASRALSVVAKKLSNQLSVNAIVNQLIQNASDIQNLALLFAGWSAFS